MRLVTFDDGGGSRAGVLVSPYGSVVDLGLTLAGDDRGAFSDVRSLLAGGADLQAVDRAATALAERGDGVDVATVRLGPPVSDPDKILCIGLNYRDHAAEAGMEVPAEPTVFAKFRNSLIGATEQVVVPAAVTQLDYEGELAVVVGKRASEVSERDALSVLAGAMVFNDLTARDLQLATSQWTMGKAIDTFAPCGPALVTLDEVGDLTSLRLTTTVNGQTVQDDSIGSMVFPVETLVARLSRVMTLEPGDIIATGTPAGVGFKRTPPLFLWPGDQVEVSVSGLGTLSNQIVARRCTGAEVPAGTDGSVR